MSQSSYPTIDSDRDRLIQEEPRSGNCFVRHKRLAIFLVALLLIALGHGLAIYFIYFKCSHINCMGLKVISLNSWGMPATFGSQYKPERMEAIGNRIADGEYDVFLLEELWMQPDHDSIAAKVPQGYEMTGFRQLSLPTCDGRVGPDFCSGLAVVSKYPIKEVEFNSYTWHGDPVKALIDGEWLARKGVGRVRIEPSPGLKVDVFVTHTAADPDSSHGYNNSYYRVKQVRELMDSYVTKSQADIVLLGGDFNAEPETEVGKPYQMIIEHMKNCVQEVFYKLDKWLDANFATYGNAHNSFTGGLYKPVTYDYIFHKTVNPERTQTWTNWFELPLFKTKLKSTQEHISLSDHEGIESNIYFWK